MPVEIPLTNLVNEKGFLDLEKSSPLAVTDSSSSNINSHFLQNAAVVRRQLITALLLETIISLTIYFNYDSLCLVSPVLGPSLLGSSTAALAQSLNQYSRMKFSLSRLIKFIVWGSINGYFTVIWIDILIMRVDNLAYRVIIDQTVGAPVFQLIFSILSSLWDHGELSVNTRNSYFKSLKYSYCFWPFFSVCSFVFIPKVMMFPANCLANLIWNLILSKLS
ncbi:uncharacterized protein RJT20DRAFT_126187 [Scheffersomyces xylosifermentans]|uniref:uncharacterized protein n=1 Tax=Scheffersomyces xylosifermentans TaxID=1304137 RepID=UPI00315CF6BF